MDGMGIGWFLAIVIGGLAGWLAGKFMDLRFGIFMNIIIGIVGAAVASALLPRLGVASGAGPLNYLINGFIGAVILLFFVKIIRK